MKCEDDIKKSQTTHSGSGLQISLPRVGSSIASISILVVLVGVWAMFISPNRSGQALTTAIRAIENMSMIPGSAPPYAKVKIEPIRGTYGSVWSNNIASMASNDTKSTTKTAKTMSGILTKSHGPGVIMATNESAPGLPNQCNVKVSAEAFDFPGTPYAPLYSRIGSQEDSFVVALAHEMAHCYWHPGPIYENRMNKIADRDQVVQKMTKLMPLMLNIAESYSDSYALIFLARLDRSLYARAYQGLTAFRSVTAGLSGNSKVHNTLNAIEAVSNLAPTLPGPQDPLNVRWDVTNRYVMSAALTGSMNWMMGQGVSREDSTSSIRFVLEGQGIEFVEKNIHGKDYLIVAKAPEGMLQDMFEK